ncbi:MAG TPA: SpoIIE family protein phosphatase [Streptosporangiaceae bacterium]|nr:SpoIIE family protein phosphatase [Streptosporangiaceae bacterium]
MVAELQEALLPTALPVLPQVRVAARYLVAGHEQAAGGDWFDAISLPGGSVALIVGDVVGHGVAACAAMGQLRAVLAELLAAEPDLGQVLVRTDAFAARNPAMRAATLALAVLDPADGTLCYTTCGHPPPLVVGADGPARFLDGTGTGPLGTGSSPVLATGALAPGELLLLYSDGLIERPNRTIGDAMAELAKVAADATANRTLTAGAAPTAAERVCQLTVELLTRTGQPGTVELTAALGDGGNVECTITDHGNWQPPDHSDADRGHGLMVAGHVVDTMLVSHPPQSADDPAGIRGTVVSLRLRLSRPATLASGHHSARAAAYSPATAFTVDTSIEESGTARALVTGPVDIITADRLARRLLAASRGGTVPLVADLTGVTQLASAGVRALYLVRDQLTVHQQGLTLVTAAGSSAHVVLDLVQLSHIVEHDLAL